MTKYKEISLKHTDDTILISLPEDELHKLIIDLNIALDRHSINNIVSDKLIEKEKEIIQRAKFLKQGIAYTHINYS